MPNRSPLWALIAALALAVLTIAAWMIGQARSERDRAAADRADRAKIRAKQDRIEAEIEVAREERRKIIELLRLSLPPGPRP